VTDLGFPLEGSTLIVGPSQAGKTQLTARAMEAWIDQEGAADVVLLEFGPEYDRNGTVLGRRLERYTDIPSGVWVGTVDAHAPRAESEHEAELRELARANAMAAADRLADAPAAPAAVFVNDVTIGYQHADGAIEGLLDYCDTAETAVLNAFESDELGTDDPVSARERDVVQRFRTCADRTITLER
jgi:hypothetical protein